MSKEEFIGALIISVVAAIGTLALNWIFAWGLLWWVCIIIGFVIGFCLELLLCSIDWSDF